MSLEKINHLLAELKTNPFYAPRLPREVSNLEQFRDTVGFTTKTEIIQDCATKPPYGSNLTYDLGNYSRFCQSSGTSAGPLPTVDTAESWSSMLDVWDEVYSHAGVNARQPVFFAFSFGPFLGFWTAFDAATRRGNLAIPGGGLSSQARVQIIERYAAEVLCCTPTYAIRLGEVRQELRIETPISQILVAGEPGGSIAATRGKIESLWPGAKVWDHHGMTEVGPVSYESAEAPLSLLVSEDAFFAEVLDPNTGHEVSVGQEGELVLTTLNRLARPLVRYRTGDLVRKAEYRGQLCLAGGILGRADDMVVIRGVNVYPSAVEKVIRQFEEVDEFQVIRSERDAMAELEIAIESTSTSSADLRERIEEALKIAFSLRIPVKLAEPQSLPRFEFKSKRWVER